MSKKLTRREFLKVAAVTSAVAIPAATGYGLLHSVEGEYPEEASPYVPAEELHLEAPQENKLGIPILVLFNETSANPFGKYLGEILLAEGLNCFTMTSLSELRRLALERFDIVLLAEGSLNPEQIQSLERFVWNGGRLVAMRPDVGLSSMMGIMVESSEIEDGYLQVVEGHPITAGIEKQSMQFHGKAYLYQLAGAEPLAWISPAAEVEPLFPAVTMNRYGSGVAVAWAYDLAKSVALTRQGNPILSRSFNTEEEGFRPVNMFENWVDLDRIQIPQADEQQRLLTNVLLQAGARRKPVPRVYYFPSQANGLFIVTGDSHGNPSSAIDKILPEVEAYQGHMSIYYTAFPEPKLKRAVKKLACPLKDLPLLHRLVEGYLKAPTPRDVRNWRERGHEFGIHPYVEEGLQSGWEKYWNEFTAMGYGPVSQTARTHRIQWKGWVETAKVQASYGIELNLDYYHWGEMFRDSKGEWLFGHFTGSALPMRFIDENGQILQIYQQLTQIADDHMLDLFFGGVAKLPVPQAVEIAQDQIQRSLDHFPAVFVGQFHVDPYAVEEVSEVKEERFLNGILSFATSKGMPLWTAEKLLHFSKSRAQIQMRNIQWLEERKLLTLDVASPEGQGYDFELLLPCFETLAIKSVSVNGQETEVNERQLAGLKYCGLRISAGESQVRAIYEAL